MSIRLMSVVWEIEFPTQSQKLIALKLADYASDMGTSIFPAVNTIARHTGCDERTVQRVMKAFRNCGIIHLVKEGGTGPKATNEWLLNVAVLSGLANGEIKLVGGATELEIEGELMGDNLSAMGDILSPEDAVRVTKAGLRVTPVSPKGGSGVTQSINNHQIETPGSRGRAGDKGARASASLGDPRLILPEDWQWTKWIIWADDKGSRSKFETEGAMVIFADEPSVSAQPPKLPPLPSSPRYADLMAQREERLSRARGKMAAAGAAA